MASVFYRGPKSAPRWSWRAKDASGKWISRRTEAVSKREALKVAQHEAAKFERQRLGMEPSEQAAQLFREVAKRWEAQLTNRAASDDRSRLRMYVMPKWGGLRLSEVTTPALITWIAEELAARPRRVSPQTLKHCLGIVSRIFSYAVGLSLAATNPCRAIPTNRRPQDPPKKLVPWIQDDAVVREILRRLPEDVSLMFWLGNRCGMRQGEILGLRLSDLDTMDRGCIRVRFSRTGPLKEDRRGVGKVKWAPAPMDARAVLGSWLDRRVADGAQPEDLVFPDENGRCRRKEYVQFRFNRVADALGVDCTWHQATRHSATSGWLSRGVPVDQVAAALGHHSPATTIKSYAHFIRKEFDGRMTVPLSDGTPAKVIPIEEGRAPVPPARENAEPAAGDNLQEGTEAADAS